MKSFFGILAMLFVVLVSGLALGTEGSRISKADGATHCTGDRAIAMFKQAFGESSIPMGTGKILDISGF